MPGFLVLPGRQALAACHLGEAHGQRMPWTIDSYGFPLLRAAAAIDLAAILGDLGRPLQECHINITREVFQAWLKDPEFVAWHGERVSG